LLQKHIEPKLKRRQKQQIAYHPRADRHHKCSNASTPQYHRTLSSAFAERQTSFQALPGHEHYPPAATGRVDAIDPMLKISYADRGDLETAR
jgi:hypothetical protein